MENENLGKDGSLVEKKEKKNSVFLVLLVCVLISSLVGGIFGFISGSMSGVLLQKINPKLKNPVDQKQDVQVIKEKVVAEDSIIINMVEKSSPAVVSIIISKDISKMRNLFQSPFNDFFDPFGDLFNNNGNQTDQNVPTEKTKIGGGTGFFINSTGMIVTNRHVVEDTRADYLVITSDGKEYPAKVLARDPIRDFAVIKIEGDNFPVLETGDSDALKVGQTVIAIGNSLGEFSNTVSKGIISGLKRNLVAGSGFGQTEKLTNIIQTDAAINPGNSGGPLLNINGQIVGINVAIAQGAQSVGFTIPINQVKKIINQVETKGKISVPFLGVRYVLINQEMQKANNLEFDYGAMVLRGEKLSDLAVVPGSPADKAGIVEGDIILEINGTKIDDSNNIADMIAKSNVGDEIDLKIQHKGAIKDKKIILEERKQ